MVKVLKPKPKSLEKLGGTLENGIKKKKLDKGQKTVKVSKNAKAGENGVVQKKKAKLVEKVVKAAEIVAPKEKKKKVKALENNVGPVLVKKTKKTKEGGAITKPKRPLVLAPPVSPKPGPVQPVSKAGKVKAVKKLQADANNVEKSKPKLRPVPKQKKVLKEGAIKAKTKLNKVKSPAASPSKIQKKKKVLKAPKHIAPPIFEPVDYDEEKFDEIVSEENVKKIAIALKTLVEEEVSAKKTSIFSDYRYFLNVTCFKIPSCPKRMVKLTLKHSLVGEGDDVVIVVPDLQRGAKVDYEPTIHHYEDLFREAGVEGLKIVPFNQLRKECSSFESVRKFGNTYDYFLCDGRIVGHVVGFCGKVFQKPRTTFHSVRLENAKNIKLEIDKALHRTSYKQLHKGDLISIPIGNHTYTPEQLAENVMHVVSQLKTSYPGGMGNVRSLYLKIDMIGTSSLPIYISANQAPDEAPYVVGVRESRLLGMRKEVNETLNKFILTKEAELRKLSKQQMQDKRATKLARAELLAAKNADPRPLEEPQEDAETDEEYDEEAEEVVTVEKKKEKEVVPVKKARKKNANADKNVVVKKNKTSAQAMEEVEELVAPVKKAKKEINKVEKVVKKKNLKKKSKVE